LSQPEADTPSQTPAGKSREWNFHPALPIAMSPVFDTPPHPKAALAWLKGTWLKRTPPVNHLICAALVYLLLWPSMAQVASGGAGWIWQIIAVNFGMIALFATALHLYLYVYAGQQMRLKFDVRPMEKSPRFTFGSQTWDNVFWTLASSVVSMTIWALAYFWAAAQGYIATLPTIATAPVWFVAFFFIIRLWQSFHFYWIHRLIHIPWMFKNVHHLRHRNINVGPWSGLSMHPVESLLYFSGLSIHFLLPSHPIHVLFHMFALSLGAVFSHAGFDTLLIRDKKAIKAGDFHHQLHHRYFECN